MCYVMDVRASYLYDTKNLDLVFFEPTTDFNKLLKAKMS